jgi:dTMP kinase
MQGIFVAFEGIDGSGTTTQSRRLHDALVGDHVPVHLTQEPSTGPVGMVIRQVLAGRLVVTGFSGPRPPGWASMTLLFAADRLDHLEAEVLPNLADGITVITDRYVYSSLLYQGETSGDLNHMDWIETVNRRAPRPDLTIVLDVRSEIADRRRRLRRENQQIYEDRDLQERLARRYRELPTRYPNDRIVLVDGNGEVDDVHRVCLALVQKLRNGG